MPLHIRVPIHIIVLLTRDPEKMHKVPRGEESNGKQGVGQLETHNQCVGT